MAGIDVREVAAALFDLDGVVTDTARVHAAAWRRLFDDFLATRPAAEGEDHRPFSQEDYLREVDGRSREDGARAFLSSRGIRLPDDGPDDGREDGTRAAGPAETVHDLTRRKDACFQHALADGVHVYPDARELVTSLRGCGLTVAVVSASRNCAAVLARAGIDDLFDARVDGLLAARRDLPGKPDPAVFLAAAELLGVPPDQTAVLEDAEAGVLAGRRGAFGLVVGVDRAGDGSRLRAAGAHVVVSNLDELAIHGCAEADRPATGPGRAGRDAAAGETRGQEIVDGPVEPSHGDGPARPDRHGGGPATTAGRRRTGSTGTGSAGPGSGRPS
ncbi:beta-phosphoglucomutase family hydrolase [Actinoalloteichus hoggarensis]|uniref:Beta-phosphoglucomutase n=1 Tax=Actinoalloteichus hoggarensis TaxID=1470176 RepID=A0A221W5T4_9PSEU|nr:beta-phosphoglucomutase family hydrolase [Actinoalloteichus hoggarensis]ASO21270.1 putative glycosyl hydrolase [Actinoalloteichus hoggarensis]MBB5921202.1 beta-phosphoglucomutase family hydrolase [Actinoalloteichus hoggarensis]